MAGPSISLQSCTVWRHTWKKAATEELCSDRCPGWISHWYAEWKEICVFAWKLIFQIVKHSSSTGCLSQLQPNFPTLWWARRCSLWGKLCTVPTLRGTPLICLPSQNKVGKHKDLDSWPVSGMQLFFFHQVGTTSSSTKWDGIFKFPDFPDYQRK